MTVLITSGAGYIGSHAVLAFREAGYEVVDIHTDDDPAVRRTPSDVRSFLEGN